MPRWRALSAGLDWRHVLRQADQAEQVERLRARTNSGRPCGGEHFVASLEKRLGKSLAQRPVGCPRKEEYVAVPISYAIRNTETDSREPEYCQAP